MSNEQLLSDLLKLIVEEQWSGKTNTACQCHPEYIQSCPNCKEPKYTRIHPEKGYMSSQILNTHKPTCERLKLMKETEAILTKYNEQQEEQGEDGVWVPSF